MNTKDKILQQLESGPVAVVELSDYLGISRQSIHKALKSLLAEGRVLKLGSAPTVFYSLASKYEDEINEKPIVYISSETEKNIENTFFHITPLGYIQKGWQGFVDWCMERNMQPSDMAKKYIKVQNKYKKHRENGLINGYSKIQATFKEMFLDEVFYLDFYSIEIFGKTKVGQLLLYAKQSQDIKLMNQLIDDIKPAILQVIERYKIDGVLFVPPTIQRENQFMRQLEKRLALSLRKVEVAKVKTPIIIPQKTLSKLDDRIINAQQTIIVNDNNKYKNILIIDDAVGSGATLHETAKKIRQKNICSGSVIGLAITGSAKGFDVISEV